MKSVLFIAASVEWWHCSETKTALITHHGYICCCQIFTQCQTSCSSFCPSGKQARGGQEAGMDTARVADLSRPEGLCHIVSCSAIKKKCWGQPSKAAVAGRLAGHWQAHGRSWVVTFVSLVFSPSLINCQDLTFAHPILFLAGERRSKRLMGAQLLSQIKPPHTDKMN